MIAPGLGEGRRMRKRGGLAFLGGVALLLGGCITLMAPYDEKIDDMATGLQREVGSEIELLRGADKPDCLYPANAAFYRSARVDVSALGVRATAHEMNAQTITQIEDLRGALNDMEALHKIATQANRCMRPEEFSDIGRAFDQITGAIIKLEVAKKRGRP
jgi:hypothetical protein